MFVVIVVVVEVKFVDKRKFVVFVKLLIKFVFLVEVGMCCYFGGGIGYCLM